MVLFLIRHGQTTANETGTYSGQTDAKLTELGKAQAKALVPILEKYTFDKVYSSDLSRATDTQRIALPHIEGIRTPLIREIDVGSLAGQSIMGTREKYGNLNNDFTSFGGENYDMLTARMRKFLDMLESQPCERVAAFAHGGLIRSMLRIVLGNTIDQQGIITDNCSIAVFKFNGERWQLHAWNLMGNV